MSNEPELCKVCNVIISQSKNMRNHEKTKKHLRNLADKTETAEPVTQSKEPEEPQKSAVTDFFVYTESEKIKPTPKKIDVSVKKTEPQARRILKTTPEILKQIHKQEMIVAPKQPRKPAHRSLLDVLPKSARPTDTKDTEEPLRIRRRIYKP